MSARVKPKVIEVDAAGSALLDLLVELGHLEEPRLTQLNERLFALEPEGGVLSVAEVKRVAALVISEHLDDMDAEQRRVLDKEWPLLFH